ncbi:GNAT family N-acetyltransferase [Paractinoplanes durhamensis]|uniref:N-acetyltransferase n=1 Tax=Paractinoplanes durhamensis TaxID=113563 RepID=A0ABQ3YQB0_9ACTN|nr:GNAT family N-acetyltransferase [Actinoplanes durhamensis]GID99759.1 N-acetyltransferase [Actinoplanes durhamensis]
MSVSIGPLESPDDAYGIDRASSEHDQPDVPLHTREVFAARLATPPAGHTAEHFLARFDAEPAGHLELAYPQADNLGNVMVELKVSPSFRRRGVGRALWEVAVERARATGRVRLLTQSVRSPSSVAFAAAVGAKAALEELRSRLDLGEADQARYDEMLAAAWATADGYRLIQWSGVPPEEVIDDVAALDSSFMAETPTGDLDWEPEKVDADRVRATEEGRIRRGRVTFHTGALHGDRLVAWTTINCAADRGPHAWQNVTLVASGHRGHRLGLLVKLANLAYARTLHPGLEVIDTFNATTNEHMLRINREMGFRVVESAIHWQRDL